MNPEGDSASNGSAECGVNLMKRLVRATKYSVEDKLKQEIPLDSDLMGWVVHYAAQVHNSFCGP